MRPLREIFPALARPVRDFFTGGRALEKRSSLKNPDETLLAAFGTAAKSGAIVSENTAFNVPTFNACITILSQSMAMLPLKVYRPTASGADEDLDHPATPLLSRKAGPGQTAYQWCSHKMVNTCIGGNGYSRIYRDAYFEPVSIVPLKPVEVEPRLLDSGRLVYRYKGQILQDHEVIHLRGLSSNGYTGRSPLHDLRDSIGLAMVAQDFTSATFRNGNRQPGVVEGPAQMDRAKANEFLKFWQENYAGANNGGKLPMFFGGVTWKEAGFSNADAELIMSRKFDVEEIARAFRVPLTLLQSMEKSTSFGTGIAELSRGFVNFTLRPWAANWQQELEDKLLTEKQKTDGYHIRFDFSLLLSGSPQEQAIFWKTLLEIGVVTANEVRRALHMKELPDGTANLTFVPSTFQPSAAAGKPTKADAIAED
jgi:HK97 family phage portal protein